MSVITASWMDLANRVQQARLSQRLWQTVPIRDRLVPICRLRRLLVERRADLCAAVERDIEKRPEETLGGDILPLAEACRFLERRAATILAPRKVRSSDTPLWFFGQRDVIHRRPRGVVGIIGTWNYPLFLNGVQMAQALAAGNAVVWKPSEVAPASAAILGELFDQAGFPAGLIQQMPATRDGGPALAEADIDHVVFTGGADTGRRLARRLGERLISSTLELSGCDAFVVLPDADVDLAARAAWFGATLNRGQTCLASRRAFVHRDIYAVFCGKIRELAGTAQPQRLALASAVQQARDLVQAALKGGAKRAFDATDAEGDPQLFRATALIDVQPGMAICRDASFAPVLSVLPWDEESALIEAERQCPYALGAAIFTANKQRADSLAAQLRSGAVTVNDVIAPTAHPATPFGGRGDSGWRTTQGAEGLLDLTVAQVVSHKSGRFRPHYDLAAGRSSAGQAELLAGLLEAGHSATVRGRLIGWWRAIRAARRLPKDG